MSKLKAKNPQTAEPRKPQMVIYGPSGVGKTWFSLSFPLVYYIDTEGGASRAHYMERLKRSGGSYLGPEEGANDFNTIIEQFKALSTEKHQYKTVVVDSITKPFLTSIANEGERLGDKNAFGADKKPAIQFMRRLIAAVHRLDMNVIFVAHEKAEWGQDGSGQRVEVGKVADTYDKLIYELDLALQISKRGPQRLATIKKSRLIGFPEAEQFKLDYPEFAERYGKDIIEKDVSQIVLASAEQVAEIIRLVDLLKIDKETTEKWLEKANAENFSEFNTEQANKIIESLKSKIK
ncbi:MAG: ATP-binding protein [Verrucomicrobiae bacterium]|nr:ATP-binding protein [Verrucomicrobiae bacterium]